MTRAGSGVDGSGRIRGAATKAVVAALAKGDFIRSVQLDTAGDWTSGTEVQIGPSVGPGAGEEKIYPYVRFRYFLSNSVSATGMIIAVLHYRGGDGVPALDSASAMEDYRIAGRLYHWEYIALPPNNGRKVVDLKFRNVKLPAQEYLRLYACPSFTSANYAVGGHCDYSVVSL